MKFLMVAGEPSGDAHGAALLRQMNQLLPDAEFYGIGGQGMLRQGLRAYYTIESLQVHGLTEIVRHLPRLYKILWNLRDSLQDEQPDGLILIDYPGFNLKLAALAKQRGIPVLFYNSPQVWAWRKGRLQQIKQVVDKIIVLLPFEETLYQQEGVAVSYFGHPLINELPQASQSAQIRADLGIGEGEKMLVLGPGSRPSEVKRHLGTLLEAASLLVREHSQVRLIMPVAENLDFEEIRQLVQATTCPVKLVKGRFWELTQAADAAAVSTGTASLQTALCLTPNVAFYKVSSLTYALASRMAQVPYFAMANILAGREIVPELIQHRFTEDSLLHQLKRILFDDAFREEMIRQLEQVKAMLGQPGAYGRAAEEMVRFFQK